MFLPLLCTEECVCVVVYTLYNFRRICRIESTLTGGRFTAHLEEKFQRLIRSLKITTTPSWKMIITRSVIFSSWVFYSWVFFEEKEFWCLTWNLMVHLQQCVGGKMVIKNKYLICLPNNNIRTELSRKGRFESRSWFEPLSQYSILY